MPCYMTGRAEGDARMHADEARRRATKTTDMLCRVLTDVEAGYGFRSLDDDVHDWWREHKKIDQERD